MNEAETCAEHIDPALKAAGWGVAGGIVFYFAVLGVLGFRPKGFSRRAVS